MKTETWKYGDPDRPLHWRLPRHVRLEVPYDATHAMVDRHFAVMALCPHHWFVVIGNAEWMAKYTTRAYMPGAICDAATLHIGQALVETSLKEHSCGTYTKMVGPKWPLPNVTLACRIRTQADADRDLPQLMRCPAVERWVYVEPVEEIEMLFDDLSEWTCRECGSRAVDTEVSVGPDDVGTYHCLKCDYWGNGEDAAWTSLIHGVTVTGLACVKLGRRFIGCEIDEGYFNVAVKRIAAAIEHQAGGPLFKDAERGLYDDPN